MKRSAIRAFLLGVFVCSVVLPHAAQQPALPPPGADIVEIIADQQQEVENLCLLKGNVEVRYRGMTLRADEVTYDQGARTAEARGRVVFEQDNDRLEATETRYNLSTGGGVFHQVEGPSGYRPQQAMIT